MLPRVLKLSFSGRFGSPLGGARGDDHVGRAADGDERAGGVGHARFAEGERAAAAEDAALGVDGFGMADPQLSGIPVVMVSISDDRDRGLAMGAADYLVKPVDRDRLAGILAANAVHVANMLQAQPYPGVPKQK